MKISKFHTYLADLEPGHGTEPGKIRPVVVIQTDLLNPKHTSTLICPISSRTFQGIPILRVHLAKGEAGIREDSDILVDQVRAIDNRRFIKPIGKLTTKHQLKLLENLQILILE